MRKRCAFTLIELLVVIAIIGLLIGIIIPALGAARRNALTMKCLSNMRNMEVAHWNYMADHEGAMINVGLAHGGAHAKEGVAWINTLQEYYGDQLLHRSPVDDSPHWPVDQGGQGVPVGSSGGVDQFRRTSYGVNDYLTPVGPPGETHTNLDTVPHPSATVHMVIMAFRNLPPVAAYAGADHPHVYLWSGGNPQIKASFQVETDAHGGPERSWDSISNYGYLDGHAETQTFREVFTDLDNENNFNPALAR